MKQYLSVFLLLFLLLPDSAYPVKKSVRGPVISSAITSSHCTGKVYLQKKVLNSDQIDWSRYEQVATFRKKKNAVRLARKMRKKGLTVALCAARTSRNKKIYAVFLEKKEELPLVASAPPGVGNRDNSIMRSFGNELSADAAKIPDKTSVIQQGEAVPSEPKLLKEAAGSRTEEKLSAAPAGAGSQPPAEGNLRKVSQKEVEVARFETREPAENLREKMKGSGFETTLRTGTSDGQKTVYIVSVMIHERDSKDGLTAIPSGTNSSEATAAPREEAPVGTNSTSTGVFEKAGGYLHASATIAGVYTDNAFNTRTDKKSDFSTILSPEVWITLPHTGQKPPDIGDVSSRSPGGLVLSRTDPEAEDLRHYRMYLLYGADIPLSSVNSPSGNTTTQVLRGGFGYNSGNKLTLDVIDQYNFSYEQSGVGISTGPAGINTYKSNLVTAAASYDIGHKLRLRVDYSNFTLSNDTSGNEFRDRTDNAFAGYVFYRFRPKTSFFVEYSLIDISYADGTLNNSEQYILGGLQWDITAKSSGIIKAGYEIKDFTGPGGKNHYFTYEAQVGHKFTPKTSLELSAFRKTNETTIYTTYFVVTDGIKAVYQQMLSSKITGSLDLSYEKDNYNGALTYDGETEDRKDSIYLAEFDLQYAFRKWLRSGIGYIYSRRISNFSDFSFVNNSFYFRITGSF